MKIKVASQSPGGSGARAIMSHKDEELEWNIQTMAPSTKELADGVERHNVFEQINNYWEQCTEATQDAIFQVYLRIYAQIEACHDLDHMILSLRPLVAELFELHPQEDIDYWVRMKSDILVPREIPNEYDQSRGWSMERTYLRQDYQRLIPLAISIRTMIPVWGEFIFRVSKEAGTNFKELQAFQLLATSNVFECDAMRRLELFVRHSIPKERSLDAVILSGISSEDFPMWVLSTTVVRRLSRGDIRGVGQEGHTLVTYLHNYISTRIAGLDGTMGKVTPKYGESAAGGDENNLSKLEGFKIKQDVPAGDIAIISRYLNYSIEEAFAMEDPQYQPNPRSLILRLSDNPAFPQLVRDSTESVKGLTNHPLAYPQVTIAGWVLSKYINIRALPHTTKVDVLSMIALAQAYLWINGHLELAGLVSAVAKTSNDAEGPMFADTKVRMTRDQLEEFGMIFPYQRKASRKSRTAKSTSMALSTIELITDELSQKNWVLTLPTPMVQKLKGSARDRRYEVPSDIRIKLANLVIELNKKQNLPESQLSQVAVAI